MSVLINTYAIFKTTTLSQKLTTSSCTVKFLDDNVLRQDDQHALSIVFYRSNWPVVADDDVVGVVADAVGVAAGVFYCVLQIKLPPAGGPLAPNPSISPNSSTGPV